MDIASSDQRKVGALLCGATRRAVHVFLEPAARAARGGQTRARAANRIETLHSRFVNERHEEARALVRKGSRHDICLLKMLARR